MKVNVKKLLMAAAASVLAVDLYAVVAPVYTMTNAVVTQKTTLSGCSALSTGGEATATFYDDKTYLIQRTNPVFPDQTGIWAVINGASSYSVYMMPDDQPLADFYNSMDIMVLANCQAKYTAYPVTVSIEQPTVLIKKNIMTVKNVDGSAVATFQAKGKQQNTFKRDKKTGNPVVKYGNYSTTVTLKGTVVQAP